MQFKELQEKVMETIKRYGEKYGLKIDEEFALIKLYEEMGEFAQAVLIHKKKSRPEKHKGDLIAKRDMAEELADVLGMVIVNAKLLDIDLEEALKRKWFNPYLSDAEN